MESVIGQIHGQSKKFRRYKKIIFDYSNDFGLMSEQLTDQIIEWDMSTKALNDLHDRLCYQTTK